MGNCLTTVLKEDVSNQKLKFFDALQFKVNWSKNERQDKYLPLITYSSGTYGIRFGGIGVTIRIISNGVIKKNNVDIDTEFTINSGYDYTLSIYPVDASGVTEFLLIGLDKISSLWTSYAGGIYCKNTEDMFLLNDDVFIWSLDYKDTACAYLGYPDGNASTDLGYLAKSDNCSEITTLRLCSAWQDYNQDQSNYGHMSMSDLAKLEKLQALSSSVRFVGDLEALDENDGIVTINFRYPETFGDIAHLGKMVNATSLNIYGSRITGSLESLVSGLVASEKTAGTIGTFRSNGLVTFEGSPIDTAVYSLSWADAETIVLTPKS